MSEFEVVTRPNGNTGGNISDELLNALIETATSGKALKLNVAGVNIINWQSNMRAKLRRVQPPLKLSYRHDKVAKTLTVWTEIANDREAVETEI